MISDAEAPFDTPRTEYGSFVALRLELAWKACKNVSYCSYSAVASLTLFCEAIGTVILGRRDRLRVDEDIARLCPLEISFLGLCWHEACVGHSSRVPVAAVLKRFVVPGFIMKYVWYTSTRSFKSSSKCPLCDEF